MSSNSPEGNCEPMLISAGGVGTACYWPDQVQEAEAQLPFIPVNPSDVVAHLTHLDQTQVLLQTGAGPWPTPIQVIIYIFGTIPGSHKAMPVLCPPEPKFVVVDEIAHLERGDPTITRDTGRLRKPGMPIPIVVHGPWTFRAGLPGNVGLSVTSNFDKEIIWAIGTALISSDRDRV